MIGEKYVYETHLHTSPASRCSRRTPEEMVEFYSDIGFDGIFITNHFLDGNVGVDRSLPHAQQLEQYAQDYLRARERGEELGLSVFFGAELSYGGTDFLVYGLDVDWYIAHPEIMEMKKSEELPFLMSEGALVIQAHPYREAAYIDHIRLFPRCVHGVEVYNATQIDFVNRMASIYCAAYELIPFAGSDNHIGDGQRRLGVMTSDCRITSDKDFIMRVLDGKMAPALIDRGEEPQRCRVTKNQMFFL